MTIDCNSEVICLLTSSVTLWKRISSSMHFVLWTMHSCYITAASQVSTFQYMGLIIICLNSSCATAFLISLFRLDFFCLQICFRCVTCFLSSVAYSSANHYVVGLETSSEVRFFRLHSTQVLNLLSLNADSLFRVSIFLSTLKSAGFRFIYFYHRKFCALSHIGSIICKNQQCKT